MHTTTVVPDRRIGENDNEQRAVDHRRQQRADHQNRHQQSTLAADAHETDEANDKTEDGSQKEVFCVCGKMNDSRTKMKTIPGMGPYGTKATPPQMS